MSIYEVSCADLECVIHQLFSEYGVDHGPVCLDVSRPDAAFRIYVHFSLLPILSLIRNISGHGLSVCNNIA